MNLMNTHFYRPDEETIRENEDNWGIKLPEEIISHLIIMVTKKLNML